MLVIIGGAPVTILSSQLNELNINGTYNIFYDNGVNEDNYGYLKKTANNAGQVYVKASPANQFYAFNSIAILF